MRFSFENAGFDRYWHGGSPLKSFFWTQLSTAFGPGERFLMESARAMRSQLHDPGLVQELLDFCKQESHHIAQHLRFDSKNAELGVEVDACRRRFRAALDRATRDMDPRQKLSFTVAGEHLTVILAELLLTRGELTDRADKGVKALWIWHAVEEAEHKATCFDIFLAIEGTYWERVRTLPSALWFFTATSLWNTALLLHSDGALYTWQTLRDLGYLFGPRGLLFSFAPGLLSYLDPRFHPSHHDHSALIRAWQNEHADNILILGDAADAS